MKKPNPNQLTLPEPKPELRIESVEAVRYMAEIFHDGGCGPTNPGNAYGSYELRINGKPVSGQNRVQFGRGTNNTAEFDSLLLALDALHPIFPGQNAKSRVSVAIFTDSTIVRNWLQRFHRFNRAKCTNERRLVMADYAGRCIEKLSAFHSFTVEWNSRYRNVERFGH